MTDGSQCALIFFFQAEDGIRDRNVTGVQTCALPILPAEDYLTLSYYERWVRGTEQLLVEKGLLATDEIRSEERRVGKECRFRGKREHQKKKAKRSRSRCATMILVDITLKTR